MWLDKEIKIKVKLGWREDKAAEVKQNILTLKEKPSEKSYKKHNKKSISTSYNKKGMGRALVLILPRIACKSEDWTPDTGIWLNIFGVFKPQVI